MRTSGWVLLLTFGLRLGSAQQLTPVWVEVGEHGAAIARVVVNAAGDCPSITVNGESHPMSARLPVPRGFLPACEATLPGGAKSAQVNGHALALPKRDPSRVIVFGDTGCRIKGEEIQDCNDPNKWPFRQVAAKAAADKPDLMIHVGDYLYREDMCPPADESFCGGTPIGDNWPAWNADFFTPAAKLLAATPWVFARGNHENCERSWRGWFYYLDPHPWQGETCEAFQPPYLVQLGTFQLVLFDSSAVNQRMSTEQVDRYARELSSIQASHAWLVVHHPIWGFATSGSVPIASSPGLQKAWWKADPKGIDLVVSGHVHLFELLSFDHDLPPALVAGQGGTDLSYPIETPLAGLPMSYAKVVNGASEHQFGYTIMTKAKTGWRVVLTSVGHRVLEDCFISGRETSCRETER